MLKIPLTRFFQFLHRFISNTRLVVIFSISMIVVSLVFEGTLLRLWKLRNEYIQHVEEIAKLEVKNREVLFKIQQASDPEFLRAFATEKLDLAREDELIFIFNE